MTTITQTDIGDITGMDDNSSWTFCVPALRESDSGTGIVTTKRDRKYPIAGVLTVELDPGPAVVLAPDGNTYPFTVPDTASDLWSLIQAAVTIPPTTTHQQLLDAVDAWLASHTAVWANIPDRPAPLVAGPNVANGYAGLDGSGKIGTAQLPISAMEYKGVWNASTNSPTLADGTGNTGDQYHVGTAGSRNLGSGSITFAVGDYVLYNGSAWEKLGDGAASTRILTFDVSTGWPARPPSSVPVIWAGGDAVANPPTGSVNGDLWFPATGDGDATKEAVLTPPAVKTAAYTAVRGDLIPVDTTSGAVPITLPTAPADKTRIAVKVIAGTAGTNGQLVNNATIAPGGSDVFNKSGGSTLLTLSMLNQGVVLQYKASGAIWYVVSTDVPLTALDARYQPLTSNLALTTGPFPTDQLTAGFLSVPRWTVSANALALLTGVMQLTYVTCDKTQTVAGVTLRCGATAAAATPTLCRIGLYSVAANGDLTLIASTPNDTTLFAAANTSYTKAFSASVGVTLGVRYAIGTLVVSGTTLPSMCGPSTSNLGSAELAIAPRRTGQISSLSDLPSTATAASVANNSSLLYARVA